MSDEELKVNVNAWLNDQIFFDENKEKLVSWYNKYLH